MYKVVIFDFFDVIHRDPYKAWLSKHGIIDKTEYDAAMEPVDKGEIKIADFHKTIQVLSGRPLEEIIKDFKNNDLLDEEMIPYIKKLAEKYKVGLMSNAGSEEIRPLLAENNYEDIFHHIMISGETGLIKPNPEAFKNVLENLDVQAEEAIFVDDSEKNILAANDLGITSVLYENFSKMKADLEKLGVVT